MGWSVLLLFLVGFGGREKLVVELVVWRGEFLTRL